MQGRLLAPTGALLLLAASAASLRADEVSRPDAHAPIGVMGDHTHGQGEWMLSYRFMRMRMEGNRDGTESLGTSEVMQGFAVVPTEMDTEMHMLGIMYAPLDTLTLMGMVPFIRKSMDHVRADGLRFTTRSKGFGDLKLTGLWRFLGPPPLALDEGEDLEQSLHLIAGISVPTGSIKEQDEIAMVGTTVLSDAQLPYPMQLGTGTVDPLFGLTYLGWTPDWSWGAQSKGTVRLYDNSQGYEVGDEYQVTVWGARRWLPWLSTSLRLGWRQWFDYEGRDEDVPIPTAAGPGLPRRGPPTADPQLRGGERLDGSIGINLIGTHGLVRNHRFAIEFGGPFYQSLDGPQLESDWMLTAGWQYAF